MKIKRKDGVYKMEFVWDPPTKIAGRAPDRMEWRKVEITERIYDGCDCYPWRPVFAFWPVQTVSGRYIWLRKIYKRKFWVIWGKGFHMEPEVEYATLFEILANKEVV